MKNNKETLELINNDLLGFMNKASKQAGEVFHKKDVGELKYITLSEPPYKGDLGFKNHYIHVDNLAQPILDMFINDYKNRFKLMKDIDKLDFNEFKYVMFMYRRDGYVHDWTFTTKKVECK